MERPKFWSKKFFFKLFGMTQKNGWNKVDADYWKNQGWLDGKKPY